MLLRRPQQNWVLIVYLYYWLSLHPCLTLSIPSFLLLGLIPKPTTYSQILVSGSALGNPSKTQAHLPTKEGMILVAVQTSLSFSSQSPVIAPQELALAVDGRIVKEAGR